MKIYTSYFYQIRYFPKNLVPLSTCVWPPKYFGTPTTYFKDKRGVLCGLDIPPLKPGPSCNTLCVGKGCSKHPDSCEFLKKYYDQLTSLQFSSIIKSLQGLKERIEEGEKLQNVDFALIFYETPSNPCSERRIVQKWFKENGMEIKEWLP